MNARQARSLLELIADLYTVANTPEPPPPTTNGMDTVANDSRIEAVKSEAKPRVRG